MPQDIICAGVLETAYPLFGRISCPRNIPTQLDESSSALFTDCGLQQRLISELRELDRFQPTPCLIAGDAFTTNAYRWNRTYRQA